MSDADDPGAWEEVLLIIAVVDSLAREERLVFERALRESLGSEAAAYVSVVVRAMPA